MQKLAGKKLVLADPRGFCAGVQRAIDIVDKAIELFGNPIYVKHEVVHNKFVIEKLKDRDLSLGTILIIIAILVWIIPVKLVLSILGIYGLVQIFWKKEEKIIEKHSHHHHHNNGQKKKQVKRKNG